MTTPKEKRINEYTKEKVDEMQSEYAKAHDGKVDPGSTPAKAKSVQDKLSNKPINTKSPYQENIIFKH
jgi:hypothetical protein